jgi:hypothetical protein
MVMLNSWRRVIRVARVRGLWMLLGLSMPLAAAPTLDTSFGTNGTLIQLFPPDGTLFAPGGQVHSVYGSATATFWFMGFTSAAIQGSDFLFIPTRLRSTLRRAFSILDSAVVGSSPRRGPLRRHSTHLCNAMTES